MSDINKKTHLLLFFSFNFYFVILLDFIKIQIDPLTFRDSFDGNFSNVLDKKPNLNTESITNFNEIQSSVLFESDIDKSQSYAQWEYINTFFLNVSILGFNKICKLIKSKF